VVANEDKEFSLIATIPSAGTFTLHVEEGTTGIVNSFQNSPLALTITPAATEPTETTVAYEDDANDRIFTITAFDEYGNPTNEDDEIAYYFDGDDEITVYQKSFSIERSRFFEGFDTLHIFVNRHRDKRGGS